MSGSVASRQFDVLRGRSLPGVFELRGRESHRRDGDRDVYSDGRDAGSFLRRERQSWVRIESGPRVPGACRRQDLPAGCLRASSQRLRDACRWVAGSVHRFRLLYRQRTRRRDGHRRHVRGASRRRGRVRYPARPAVPHACPLCDLGWQYRRGLRRAEPLPIIQRR